MVFSIPSGNFGDMMGGLIAWRMGLPVDRCVIATNANDEFPIFLKTSKYQKIVPSRVCISNAMNVGHPSNLARVVDLYGGMMDETGKILSALTDSDKKRILAELDIRLDVEEGRLFIRIDKYKALNGDIIMTDKADSIHMTVFLEAFPTDKDNYIKAANSLFG